MKKNLLLPVFWALLLGQPLAQDRFADCEGAIILCDKSDLIVKKLYGVGQELSEVGFTTCSGRLAERNTAWIKWYVGRSGTIECTIEPLESGDDLDFIVYRLEGDIAHCSRKYEVRCMASGPDIGAPKERSSSCLGKIGLSGSASDTRESDGCGEGHDNFLAALEAKEGEQYILYVNNYTSGNGFRITWGGDAVFSTPPGLSLPDAGNTQMSKAVYFKSDDRRSTFKTGWTDAPLDKAFVAKTDGSRAPNVFAGCTPYDPNIEKAEQGSVRVGALYPNPATEATNLSIQSPHCAAASVEVCDVLGKRCYYRAFVVDTGEQLLQIPTESLAAGFYFVRLQVGKTAAARKLIVAAK